LSLQTTFEEACTEGVLLALENSPTSLNIYAHNPISGVNTVYRSKKTHLWESETAPDEINNIIFGNGVQKMVGRAFLEIEVPNSPDFKVQLDLLTFEAIFVIQSI
jgi:hypothetical protein